MGAGGCWPSDRFAGLSRLARAPDLCASVNEATEFAGLPGKPPPAGQPGDANLHAAGQGKSGAVTTEIQLIHQAHKFALDPSPWQARMFASHAGGARFAYNWGVARTAEALGARQAQTAAGMEPDVKVPGHFDLCRQWTAWKHAHLADPEPAPGERRTSTAWVGDNFTGTYYAALRDAAKAWQDFFKSAKGRRKGRRLGRPRFKKKGRCREAFQVHGPTLRMPDARHVTLPKIGTVPVMSDDSMHPAMRRSRARPAPGKSRHMGNRRRAAHLHRKMRRGRDAGARIIRATVSLGADGLWWCSVTAEVPMTIRAVPSRAQRAGGLIGVDFGVREVATASDGTRIGNPRHLEQALGELRSAQKRLARRQRGSARYGEAQRQVGLIHADVARLREADLHRATTALVRRHDVIAVEGWDVQHVLRAGSRDLPRRRRRNRNRALADAGVGMGRQFLVYKGQRYATEVIVADSQAKSGRTCSVDGKVRTTPLPPHQELFTSDRCAHVLDRRLNTARAVAAWARQELSKRGPLPGGPAKPRGEDVRPGVTRKGGAGRSPVKRAASSRPRRDETGNPGG